MMRHLCLILLTCAFLALTPFQLDAQFPGVKLGGSQFAGAHPVDPQNVDPAIPFFQSAKTGPPQFGAAQPQPTQFGTTESGSNESENDLPATVQVDGKTSSFADPMMDTETEPHPKTSDPSMRFADTDLATVAGPESTFIDHSFFREVGHFLNEVSQVRYWQALGAKVQDAVFGNVFATLLGLAIFLVGFIVYQRLLSISQRTVKHAIRDDHISSFDSSKLMVASVLASFLCWTPVLVIGIWLCTASTHLDSSTFLQSSGVALLAIFAIGFVYRVAQEFFSKGGLSEAIYRVDYFTARFILNRTDTAAFVLAPLVALFVFVFCFAEGRWYESVGRLTFLCILVLAYSQFHKFFWPQSKFYDRIESDEVLAKSVWPKYRQPIFWMGVSVFIMAFGLTVSGWLELAKTMAINSVLTMTTAIVVFSFRTIVRKKADELSRKANLIEELGESAEGEATRKSPKVREFIKRYNQAAQQSISFLSVLIFGAISFWIWSDLITIPEQIFQIRLGNYVCTIQVIGIASATIYMARQFPGFAIWTWGHYSKTEMSHPRIAARLIALVVVYVGLLTIQAVTQIQLPTIPWLGTLVAISLLFAARGTISDLIAGSMLLFDPRIKEGDCVEFNGQFGRVQTVNLLSSVVEDNLGNRAVIPNHRLLTETIVKSRETGAIPMTLEVGIPRDADAHLAQTIMSAVVSRDVCAISQPPPHVRFKAFRQQEIAFEIRLLVVAEGDFESTKARILGTLDLELDRHSIGASGTPVDQHALRIYPYSDSKAA